MIKWFQVSSSVHLHRLDRLHLGSPVVLQLPGHLDRFFNEQLCHGLRQSRVGESFLALPFLSFHLGMVQLVTCNNVTATSRSFYISRLVKCQSTIALGSRLIAHGEGSGGTYRLPIRQWEIT